MGKEHEHGCAECFKGYLLKKGHAVCYASGPDAPDYIFTIDGEKYSVEVTEFKADDFHYLAERHGPRAMCKKVEERVQELRKKAEREPQTGRYYVNMVLPLKRHKLKEEINRVAKVIANANSFLDAIECEEHGPTPWYVDDACYEDTLTIIPSEMSSGRGWECWNDALKKTSSDLAKILRLKKGKIEKNEPHKPKILLIFGVGDVRVKVASLWNGHKCPELGSAAKDFDCILLIWKDENQQYQIHKVLIPFNRRS